MAGKLKPLEVARMVAPGKYPDGDGLYLIVASATSRNWSYRYWISGKERWHGLGSLQRRRRTHPPLCRDSLIALDANIRAVTLQLESNAAAHELAQRLDREAKARWRADIEAADPKKMVAGITKNGPPLKRQDDNAAEIFVKAYSRNQILPRRHRKLSGERSAVRGIHPGSAKSWHGWTVTCEKAMPR
jgi:hypothetical protein